MSWTAARDPWARFAPAGASPALRERVLAASRQVAAASPPATRVDRIWFSRRCRLGWVAALVVLAALEAALARGDAARREPIPVARAVAHEADEAAVALGLAPGGWLGARAVSGEAGTAFTREDLR